SFIRLNYDIQKCNALEFEPRSIGP
ncbi:hypothetical protein Gohar_017460, partial [Gossypium harknessii]|nr:hypothetical protein [Gossypium harknessii]